MAVIIVILSSLLCPYLDFCKVLRMISSGSGTPRAKDFSLLQRAKFYE